MTRRPLVATYRLQLRPGFGFADAAEVVPYLAALGISHLYLSPIFEAAPGSTHGYDVIDPDRLRGELGGEHGFGALVSAAHEHGIGIVVDIVPHHMAAVADNAWWWSVLERGRSSPYASHFDIDWDPPARRLRGSVLLPVLGDHYGRALDAGELRLERSKEGALVARYYDHVAPLSPETADELRAAASRRGCGIDDVLAEVNADPDRIDAILERQHHRFARWQAAAHELDYRRFFDVDSLVALRSERPDVFADTHRSVVRLVEQGDVDGLRVDHVDGLRDPAAYTRALRDRVPDAWLLVEKILRPGEQLPPWPVDGTTGYDFLASVNGLLHDAAGVDTLVEGYRGFTGETRSYDAIRVEARAEVLATALDADLERLVAVVVRVCEGRRRWRDFTRTELRDALAAALARFRTYRCYARPGEQPRAEDDACLHAAIAAAATDQPELDRDLLELLRELVTGRLEGDDEAEALARFQQLTGPVAAKGEEDTAFYRWVPLLSSNEVGTDPSHPAIEPDAFHAECRRRGEQWPSAMLTTSTHDTKRSEDVRARLAVLTEVADEWVHKANEWSRANERHREPALDAPDRVDEWFLYQTLVGAHPIPFDRAWPVIEKSLREGKRRTSWIRRDDVYEGAVRGFVEAILADEEFASQLDRFVATLQPAAWVNTLAQATLRLLAPGVPDTYQGTEIPDHSLVDPDNRRPVDFGALARHLVALGGRTPLDAWRHDPADPGVKLALVRDCLALRHRRSDDLGPNGAYHPLAVRGPQAAHVVGFARGDGVAVAVPRLVARGMPDDVDIELSAGTWRNVLTGRDVEGGSIGFGELRGGFPVAVVERV